MCLYSRDYNNAITHSTYNCPSRDFIYFQNIDYIKKEIDRNEYLKPGTACYRCYLPQNICLTTEREIGGCRYPNIVIELLLGLFGSRELPDSYIPKKLDLVIVSKLISKSDKVFNNTSSIYGVYVLEDLDINSLINRLLTEVEKDLEEERDYFKNRSQISSNLVLEDKNTLREEIEDIDNSIVLSTSDLRFEESLKTPSNIYTILDSSDNEFRNIDDLSNDNNSIIKDLNTKEEDNSKETETNYSDSDDLDNNSLLRATNKIERSINRTNLIERLVNLLGDIIINTCAFCRINKGKDYYNHRSSECSLYKELFRRSYAKGILAKKLFTEKFNLKDKERIIDKNYSDNICYKCLLSSSICFSIRKREGSLRNCVLDDEIYSFYYILYEKRLVSIPFHYYTLEYKNSKAKGIEYFWSNSLSIEGLDNSIAGTLLIKYLEEFSIKKDTRLPFKALNIGRENKEDKEELDNKDNDEELKSLEDEEEEDLSSIINDEEEVEEEKEEKEETDYSE